MRPRVTLTFGGLAALAVAVGWFLLSHQIAHTDIETAVSESLGAVLVVLLLLSIIGAIRHGNPDASDRDE